MDFGTTTPLHLEIMSDYIPNQIQLWRQKAKEGTLSTAEMIEAIRIIRQDREPKMKAPAAPKVRATKAPAAPKASADDLLAAFMTPAKGPENDN